MSLDSWLGLVEYSSGFVASTPVCGPLSQTMWLRILPLLLPRSKRCQRRNVLHTPDVCEAHQSSCSLDQTPSCWTDKRPGRKASCNGTLVLCCTSNSKSSGLYSHGRLAVRHGRLATLLGRPNGNSLRSSLPRTLGFRISVVKQRFCSKQTPRQRCSRLHAWRGAHQRRMPSLWKLRSGWRVPKSVFRQSIFEKR